MAYRFAADAVLLVHLLFVLWVIFGGLAVLWRARLAPLHLPALLWGIWIIGSHGVCPLTPLENELRLLAGEGGYSGGFIEQYLVPLIYPPGLSAAQQTMLALVLIVLNAALYFLVWQRHRRR